MRVESPYKLEQPTAINAEGIEERVGMIREISLLLLIAKVFALLKGGKRFAKIAEKWFLESVEQLAAKASEEQPCCGGDK